MLFGFFVICAFWEEKTIAKLYSVSIHSCLLYDCYNFSLIFPFVILCYQLITILLRTAKAIH